MTIAVTLFNGLGDGLLARPALRALRQRHGVLDVYCLAGQETAIFGGLGARVVPRDAGEVTLPQGDVPAHWISFNAYHPVPLEAPFLRAWQSVLRTGFSPYAPERQR